MAKLYPHDALALRRIALAHAMTRAVAADAVKQGGVAEDELASWTAYHWAQVDRPAMSRTTHALVRVKPGATSADVERAEQLASEILAAVSGASDSKSFEEKAKAVPTNGLDVKVEGLDFVAADGRVMKLGAKSNAQGGTFDPAFAKAAAALSSVGQLSPVTRTGFGFHVIRLEETLPPVRLDASVREEMARADVLDRRARLALQSALTAERQLVNPAVERSAEEATAKVLVE